MGRQTLAKFDAIREEKIEEIFSHASDEELHRAAELLLRVTARVVDLGSV
jgi:hypothetical protein